MIKRIHGSSIGSGSGERTPESPESPTAAAGLVTITPGRSRSRRRRPQSPSPQPWAARPRPSSRPPPSAPPTPSPAPRTAAGVVALISAAPTSGDKKVIATKVLGTVKWFNIRNGYSFINRNDTKEDVFVHQVSAYIVSLYFWLKAYEKKWVLSPRVRSFCSESKRVVP